MCNLSKGVEEKGFKKGRQEGREEGRQEGIMAMVSALKDLQSADSIILNKIKEKFHLAEETAKMYL
jgi:predicted transposase YdaD